MCKSFYASSPKCEKKSTRWPLGNLPKNLCVHFVFSTFLSTVERYLGPLDSSEGGRLGQPVKTFLSDTT